MHSSLDEHLYEINYIYLGFFKFYQPKATSGGFLIFEWTLDAVVILNLYLILISEQLL
jgi:hypothetical protein